MSRELRFYSGQQVFLNYPFDQGFQQFADAMAFGVVAAGLLPLCALDFTHPDTLRLTKLVEAIGCSGYSIHDLSRAHGEGPENLARMNMPVEMGMALFHALDSQYGNHRCAFVVPTPHSYQKFASDIAGLDPMVYHASEDILVGLVYEWLTRVVPRQTLSLQPRRTVIDAFAEFKMVRANVAGPGKEDATHDETREVMYRVCAERGWWDWRGTRAGREVFPLMPIQWSSDPGDLWRDGDLI